MRTSVRPTQEGPTAAKSNAKSVRETPKRSTVTRKQLERAAKLRAEGATWSEIREATGNKLGSSGWFRHWERGGIEHIAPGQRVKPKAEQPAPAAEAAPKPKRTVKRAARKPSGATTQPEPKPSGATTQPEPAAGPRSKSQPPPPPVPSARLRRVFGHSRPR